MPEKVSMPSFKPNVCGMYYLEKSKNIFELSKKTTSFGIILEKFRNKKMCKPEGNNEYNN